MRKEFVCVVSNSLLALGFFCAAGTQVADAQTTINVPADQPTIQAGIDAAANGDTVMVAPGSYFENLNFNGKFITVTSSAGPATTIIDGGGLGPVVIFDSNEGGNSVLNGFTLQNGLASLSAPAAGAGGGIFIYRASPTITNNVITGNRAVHGIGIEIHGGSPLIRGNTITGNTQAEGDGAGGGGIEADGDSVLPPGTPQIVGNTITNNSMLAGGNGGGIEVGPFSSPTIQNNYIAGNSVYNSGGGISLESDFSPVVTQNIVINNSAGGGGSGGGIYAGGQTSAIEVVVNNTIWGNTAFDGSSGIFADRFPTITISNNIVVAASGQNGIVCSPFSSTFPTFSHNDVTLTGTGGAAWSSNCASFASTNGNISVDPQFVNPAGNDFHLQAGSPVIDAGDNTAPDLPQQDYDGNPRVAIGNPTGGTATIDMGVYEFVLTGTPVATLSPASLSFANQLVSTTSAAQTVTLSNTGSGSLQIFSISVTGDFTQSNACPATLNPGSSCAIQVSFQPAVTGARSGSLTVSSNSVPAPPAVPLSGNGVQPAISVSPAAVSFGDQPINTTAPDQIITVTNPGTASLHVSSTLVSGSADLNVILNNCSAAVSPGGSCTIEVGFTPRSVGPASATLTIASDAPTSPTTVALSGKGIDPIGTLSPSGLNFGNQLLNTSSAAQTVTLSNTGTDPLTISGISVSGDFSQTNACPATLAVGGSCTIQVTFHPTATGTRSGFLSVASNSSPPVVSDFVTGTGVNPAISVNPGSIAFGDQPINTEAPAQTITVSNPGTTTLHINSQLVSGDPDFFILTSNCVGGTGVAPGGTCSIQVEFAPKSVGPGSATLSIGSDAPTSPTNIALSANGINPIGSLSTSSLSFGSQLVSTTSAAQTITLSNTGSSPLLINSIGISGDFTQSNTCPASLNPGGSCAIQVIFQPGATGARSGSITISSNSTQPVPAVSLTGTGVDYSVSASPASISIRSGHQGQTTITVSAVGGSVSNSVALSCSNLPTGATCSFSPSSVVPGATSASSRLTINTQQSGGIKTPLGTYSISVLGTSAGVVHSTAVTITVTN